MTRLVASLLALAAVCAIGAAQAAGFKWTFGEFQPAVQEGGRANTIAPKPDDTRIIVVASESGGLFRSTDSGIHWHHLDSFPEQMTVGVAWVPSLPNVLLATALADFRTANGGGIWRSDNGGDTWTHVFSAPDPQFGAGEIAIPPAPDNAIYVATSSGIKRSSDQGKSWTGCGSTLSTSYPERVSVAALQNHMLVVAGYGIQGIGNVAYSIGCDAPWSRPFLTDFGNDEVGQHALSGAPDVPYQVYFANQAGKLWASKSAGEFWDSVPTPPKRYSNCGGVAFARLRKAPAGESGFRLYYGDSCDLYVMTPTMSSSGQLTYDGTWAGAEIPHSDTRDLAFKADSPWLLGSDGGLAGYVSKTVNGGLKWSAIGTGPDGYDALQITGVRHQEIGKVFRFDPVTGGMKLEMGEIDFYYGTQDNYLRASTDGGMTWSNHLDGEGFNIQAEPSVPDEPAAQITLRQCNGPQCWNMKTGAGLSDPRGWQNPPGDDFYGPYSPVILHKDSFFQAFPKPGNTPSYGIAEATKITVIPNSLKVDWTSYAEFPERPVDLPRLSRSWLRSNPHLPPLPVPVLYVPFALYRPQEVHSLLRIERSNAGIAVRYPSMSIPGTNPFNTGIFGSLGENREKYFPHDVFAVDPDDSFHLFAPDIVNHQMMETKDGGDDWFPRPDMDALITHGGEFLFDDGTSLNIGAIEFNPQDPDMVAFGTRQSGIFVSSDRGAHWEKLPGSELATFVTSIDWINDDDLVVSTQGRGLWRARRHFELPPEVICVQCDFSPRELDHSVEPVPNPSEIARLDHALVVLNGTLQGARMEAGRLVQIYISPGATIGWRSFDNAAAPPIQVTYSSQVLGFAGANFRATRMSAVRSHVGLVIGRDGLVTGFISSGAPLTLDAARRESSMARPEHAEIVKPVGSERSPSAGKPYLHIAGVDPRAIPPGTLIRLVLSGVEAGYEVEVLIDGHVVEHAKAGDQKVIAMQVRAPLREGRHSVEVRNAKTGRAVDAMNVVVVRGEVEGREHPG